MGFAEIKVEAIFCQTHTKRKGGGEIASYRT